MGKCYNFFTVFCDQAVRLLLVRHGFYASTSSTINALQVMSYGLELELERTVVNALIYCTLLPQRDSTGFLISHNIGHNIVIN